MSRILPTVSVREKRWRVGLTDPSLAFFCAKPSFLSQPNHVSRKPLQRQVQFYEAASQPEQAAEWNKKLAGFDKAGK